MDKFKHLLSELLPDAQVYIEGEDEYDPKTIVAAIVWKHPKGSLNKFPNLAWISSLGAGVDHIIADKKIPASVQISRIVDPLLTRDMSRYVVNAVLSAKKKSFLYLEQQKTTYWKPHHELMAEKVGILGAGELGMDAAKQLHGLGFEVAVYSQSEKKQNGIISYFGKDQLDVFLASSQYLINLLPLTPETHLFLNASLFGKLPEGAILINVARGAHLKEDDLIPALDSGQLSMAILDVFPEEPLIQHHPFWTHPKIIITPHVAAVSSVASVSEIIAKNYSRIMASEPLLYPVDNSVGY